MSKPSEDVRAEVDALSKADPKAFVRRLRYVIDYAQDADDSTQDFPRVAGSDRAGGVATETLACAAYPLCLDSATAAMDSGAHADAFLILCEALCEGYKAAEQAYQARLASAQEEDRSSGRVKMRSAYVRQLAAELAGAKKAAATMLKLGVGEPDKVNTFGQAAESLRAELDARWPPEGVRRARSKQLKTDLASWLAWAFVRIGFDGTQTPFSVARGARLARQVAEKHGIPLSLETLRAYAGDLHRERAGGRR